MIEASAFVYLNSSNYMSDGNDLYSKIGYPYRALIPYISVVSNSEVEYFYELNVKNACIDGLIMLVSLSISWISVEWAIRRGERRNTQP